jgi:hypothetical protein
MRGTFGFTMRTGRLVVADRSDIIFCVFAFAFHYCSMCLVARHVLPFGAVRAMRLGALLCENFYSLQVHSKCFSVVFSKVS